MTTAASKRRRAKRAAKSEAHSARSSKPREITPTQRQAMVAGQRRYMSKLKAYNSQSTHAKSAWVIPRKGSNLHKKVFGN